ncbi:hypothetical protein Tco_1576428 [Tanacetum coccineum]
MGEVVNRCLEFYLRCMTGERPKEWAKCLADKFPLGKEDKISLSCVPVETLQRNTTIFTSDRTASCDKNGMLEVERIAILDRTWFSGLMFEWKMLLWNHW